MELAFDFLFRHLLIIFIFKFVAAPKRSHLVLLLLPTKAAGGTG